MYRRSLLLASLLACLVLFGLATTASAQSIPGDMISPVNAPTACITIVGALDALPTIQPQACRGLAQQYWQVAGDGKWHSGADSTYCLARKSSGSWTLTVLPCTDSRALQLAPDAANPAVYTVVGETTALDNYGSEVGLYSKHGGSNQQWRWFQDDLTTVNTQGCAITYPFPASDSATYARELACDRVGKVQPPYPLPAAAVRTPVFPGPVAEGLPLVTRSFAFNLQFKDHSYLRMAAPPRNWQSTGLYAPPNQVIRVIVGDATAADLAKVYAQIGVHTDVLKPTSGNVEDGNFLRHPSVVVRVKLEPGENLIRSPYGGSLVLISEASLAKTITVAVADAVQAPYFKAGETTEAEWLARRAIGVPYAEIEGDLAILHVPTSEVSTVSYADIKAVAAYYTQMVRYHNALSGLSDDAPLPHQSPQGKQRHVEDIQISAGWGHSGFPAMYFNAWQIAVPDEAVYKSAGWGVYHELGHNYQMGAWSYVYGTEATVNLWSLYAQEAFFGNSRLVDSDSYAEAIARLHDSTITNKWGTAGAFGQLVFLDQIRLAFPQQNWALWTQLMRHYRELSSTDYSALNTDQKKRDKFLELLCTLTNTNLAPHFTTWTIAISESAQTACAAKPAPTQQPWTIDGAQPLYYTGSGTGSLRREWWTGIAGATLADLMNAPGYPGQPTGTALITGPLEGPRDWGSDYGDRLRGYLHPPVTGNYDFWLAGNEAVQFRLSSDEDPRNAQLLLTVPQSTGYRGFDDYVAAIQRSQPVALVAGRQYYFDVIRKEGSGSDHAAVAWTIPAGATTPLAARKVIDGRYLSPYTGDLALRKTLASGQPATILPGSDATFTLQVVNQSSATVQHVEILDTLPAGFTLSPRNAAGHWQSGYRYVRLEALSEAGDRGPWTTVAELHVLDGNGQPLARDQWRVHDVDSENPDGPATNAFDGNPATHWHTMWWYDRPAHPHEVQIDLGGRYALSGFTYLPRQSGGNGRIGDYRFSISSDGTTWVEVAAGTFPDNTTLQTVTFSAPPANQIFGLLPGPLAPGASAGLDLVVRAADTLVPGDYTNTAEILTAVDSLSSPIYDIDSTADADPANDAVVDDQIDNGSGDEDDHDIAVIQVALSVETATPTATPTETQTPSPSPTALPTATATPAATATATTTASQATITLRLDAQPESIQNFRFTGDLGSFRLDDPNPDDGDNVRNSHTVTKAAGVYAINQIVPSGWVLAAVVCDPAVQAQVDLAAARLTLTVAAGDNITCTFVTERRVAINTRKFSDNNGNQKRNAREPWLADWTMTIYDSAGTVVATGVTSSVGKANFPKLPPGSYTVCETQQADWSSTLPGTVDPTYGQPCYAFTLQPAQTATVTFGNRLVTQQLQEASPLDTVTEAAGVTIVDDTDVPFDESGYDGHEPPVDDVNQPVSDQLIFLPVIQR
ncbi:MAG: M60 family metallopeptidase [Caldilineaceae bacterium]